MKPLSSSAFKWTWTVEGEESPKLWHTSAHRRTVALLANARFDAVENRLLPLGHFLGHSASFHKSVHLFEKSLDVNLCSLYYNCEQRFYTRRSGVKMARIEFSIAFTLSTIASFLIFFA